MKRGVLGNFFIRGPQRQNPPENVLVAILLLSLLAFFFGALFWPLALGNIMDSACCHCSLRSLAFGCLAFGHWPVGLSVFGLKSLVFGLCSLVCWSFGLWVFSLWSLAFGHWPVGLWVILCDVL